MEEARSYQNDSAGEEVPQARDLRARAEQIAQEFYNYERKVADARIRFFPQSDEIWKRNTCGGTRG
ncbi:MAG: hypothetical protein LBT58_04380 [Endomicrobium sp.]|nr:hypothetical protein [Endomicrobium sp.]